MTVQLGQSQQTTKHHIKVLVAKWSVTNAGNLFFDSVYVYIRWHFDTYSVYNSEIIWKTVETLGIVLLKGVQMYYER